MWKITYQRYESSSWDHSGLNLEQPDGTKRVIEDFGACLVGVNQ